VRTRALKLSTEKKLYCVWSGEALNHRYLDVDHCLPWAVWPCGDLWNLMPAHRKVNQKQKGARLPSDRLLRSAQDRVLDWWGSAYLEDASAVSDRFWLEANASLPGTISDQGTLDDIFDAVCLQRMRLRHDQQVPEWTGEKYLSTP
ncbi:MAG: SAM-dependent methyltransferase, partial [Gammaproteobacteria bacterium]|nr:SAM-dependent methyltransferase [Gammaproteobacteria bacterium]